LFYSRSGRTDTEWTNLHDAGRLDIVHECVVSALFLSHGIRKDAVFHAVLNGPPKPPRHVKVDGETLHDVRTDQQTWTIILKKTLGGRTHPGVTVDRTGFETLVRGKAETSQILILEEKGKPLTQVKIARNPLFILGDHVGLPKTAERFALRYGEKISLGSTPYLAAHCITVLNHHLDTREVH
jgi:tRNA (pseudouridine54-N1)-methyltransferase